MAEQKLEEKIQSEKVDFDEIASVMGDPTIGEKAKKLTNGFNIFYEKLQKDNYKDKSEKQKKEMGLDEGTFVPDVKPVLTEGKAKGIVDSIALQYANISDSKTIKDLAKQLEKAKENGEGNLEQIRTTLFGLVGVSEDELLSILRKDGLSAEMKEALAKNVEKLYQNDKIGPYISKINDFQREPLSKYLVGKNSKLDVSKLKAMKTQELIQVFTGYTHQQAQYDMNRKHIEGMKNISPEERDAKLAEVKKMMEGDMKKLGDVYKN